MAFLSEIFSSFQGEGKYVGKRQIFVRFAGCPLNCYYCDTRYAKEVPPKAKVPGGELENPVSPGRIVEVVKELVTPDLHSISLTGGEPLAQPDLLEVTTRLKKEGFSIYLESSGYPPERIEEVAPLIDYAAIDVKLPSHRAMQDYDSLISSELKCIKTLVEYSSEVFVKIVIDENTPEAEILEAIRKVKDFDVEIILQPVTYNEIKVSKNKITRASELVGSLVGERVRVLPQMHKYMKIRRSYWVSHEQDQDRNPYHDPDYEGHLRVYMDIRHFLLAKLD